jgi:hypothetical protein
MNEKQLISSKNRPISQKNKPYTEGSYFFYRNYRFCGTAHVRETLKVSLTLKSVDNQYVTK